MSRCILMPLAGSKEAKSLGAGFVLIGAEEGRWPRRRFGLARLAPQRNKRFRALSMLMQGPRKLLQKALERAA